MKYKDVVIQYPKAFEEKKKRIINAGSKNLHVLSDFDRTITSGTTPEGKRTETVISKLRSDPKYLGEEYLKKAHELFDIYHPIEISTEIPFEEKKAKMYEWWMRHFDLLVKYKFNKQVIKKVVEEKPLRFRKGALEFISLLYSKDIPLIFMSAAPGDLLIEYLKKNHLLTPNVHVISNRYEYDEKGNAVRILEPIIHVLNKSEVSLKDFPLYEQIKNRKNIILLGDDVSDAEMAEGFDYNDIIRIGFLNENIKERLNTFKDKFDVVILNDGNMDFVNDLIKEIK